MRWLKIILAGPFLPIFHLEGHGPTVRFQGIPRFPSFRNVEHHKAEQVTAAEAPPSGTSPRREGSFLTGIISPSPSSSIWYLPRIPPSTITWGLNPGDSERPDRRYPATSYVQGPNHHPAGGTFLSVDQGKTITRKLREIVLALRIEKALTQEQISTCTLIGSISGKRVHTCRSRGATLFRQGMQGADLRNGAACRLAPAPTRYSPLNDFTTSKRRQCMS